MPGSNLPYNRKRETADDPQFQFNGEEHET